MKKQIYLIQKKDAEQQDIEDGVLDYVHTKTQEKMEMIVHAKFDTYKDYKVKCNFTKQDTIKDKPKTNFTGKTVKEQKKQQIISSAISFL